MPRRPASITQADIARCLRAAKQEGARGVEIRCGDSLIYIPLSPQSPSDDGQDGLEPKREIVL